MHVSIGGALIGAIIITIILLVATALAAGALTVQEAEVREAGGGDELGQLPGLDPGEESLLRSGRAGTNDAINMQSVYLKVTNAVNPG